MTSALPSTDLSSPVVSHWRSVLESSPDTRIDLESAIGFFFVGDTEFTRAVVETIEKILDSGDMHKWAELKRFDAHAAKHQRIAPDHLLNITCMLINRICNLDGSASCPKYRDIVYDRIENFHNQCRDEIPQSVSRFRAKFEYLYTYNVKSYQSILQLVGTYILKANLELANELGKRIASNHNHWFNFVHMVEFVRSLIDGINHPLASELLVVLGPEFFRIISGLCGRRLGGRVSEPSSTILETSGVVLSPSLVADGWIGSLLIDVLDIARRSIIRSNQVGVGGGNLSNMISTCLNTLASLDTNVHEHPLIINTIISMMPDLISSASSPEGIDLVACEILNFLLCFIMKCLVESDWSRINLEAANQFLLRLVLSSSNERLRSLTLKWLRAMILGPLSHPGVIYVWKSLLALDSPVFEFVLNSIGPVSGGDQQRYTVERTITCYNGIELIRSILVRDLIVAKFLSTASASAAANGGQWTSGLDALLSVRPGKSFSTCGLWIVSTEAFQLRRCRKACAYILHQCVIRNPKMVFQTLYESSSTNGAMMISENIARMILDVKFEEEMDLYSVLDDLHEIDFDHLNLCESNNLENFSIHSLISVNSLLETVFYHQLECFVEKTDEPLIVNDRLEHWLVHNNPLAASEFSGVVYHAVSGRLMALALLYESSGSMTASLLGLVETSVGVLNNELHKELVGIDALFLLLNVAPPQDSFDAHFEFLMALRVVNELLDNVENRHAILRFIQYRWEHRFSILEEMLNSTSGGGLIQILQILEFFKMVSVELLVANQLVDSDAQHVNNMREFGNAFIVSDMSRGKFKILDFVVEACSSDLDLILPISSRYPEICDPRLVKKDCTNLTIMKSQAVVDLVDSLVAVVGQWSEFFSDRMTVIQTMLESIVGDSINSEFAKHCWYSRIVPKLLLLGGGAVSNGGNYLAFNLRMIKSLICAYPTVDDVTTRAGLVESIALCLVGFAGTPEVWMIDKDANLLKSVLEIIFSFCNEIVRSQYLSCHKTSVVVSMNVVLSFIATERSSSHANDAVDVVKNILVSKPFPRVADSDVANIFTQLDKLVNDDILFRELGI